MFEFRMLFILGVNEVLYFGHLELSYSDKSVSWGNFISKTKSDLSSSKRKSSSIELRKLIEINKHSLGCFRTKITNHVG